MATEVKTEKQLEESFVSFLLELEDETQSVPPFDAVFVIGICEKIISTKTSRATTKIPGIEADMIASLDMIDTYFRANKYQNELRSSLQRIQSDAELDYFAFMQRNGG